MSYDIVLTTEQKKALDRLVIPSQRWRMAGIEPNDKLIHLMKMTDDEPSDQDYADLATLSGKVFVFYSKWSSNEAEEG